MQDAMNPNWDFGGEDGEKGEGEAGVSGRGQVPVGANSGKETDPKGSAGEEGEGKAGGMHAGNVERISFPPLSGGETGALSEGVTEKIVVGAGSDKQGGKNNAGGGSNTESTTTASERKSNDYRRHDVFNNPHLGGIADEGELWEMRFAACSLLKEFHLYKGMNLNNIWLNSTYLVHTILAYGKWKKEDFLGIVLACFVLAAKSVDISFRLTSLVTDNNLIKLLYRMGTLPPYARRRPTESELEAEFAPVESSNSPATNGPPERFTRLVFVDAKMYKEENFDYLSGQPVSPPRRTSVSIPFVLPSLVSAYEFQILNLRGFELDLHAFFPGAYFGNIVKNSKALGLSKEGWCRRIA